MRGTRPNILMVITHDTGRRLGCYGARVETPRLNGLAAEGMRLDQYFCTAPQCSPSRGSIFTGRFPHRNGLMGLAHVGWRLHPQERCLAQYLAEVGYETALCGMQHEHDTSDPGRLGYGQLLGRERHMAAVAREGARFLAAHASAGRGGRPPFLLVAGVTETHRPFDRSGYVPDDPAGVDVPAYLPDVAAVRQELAGFGGLVRAVDSGVGLLLDALAASGLAEDTLVLYTTDHGIAFPRAKGMGYDPGLETALLARWPSHIPAGVACGALTSNVDLLPTLLDVAGVPLPPGLDGVSLLPQLGGGPGDPTRQIHFELTWHDRYNPLRGVRGTRWKYVRNFDPESPEVYLPADIYRSPSGEATRAACYARPRAGEELYDLRADPSERRNRAGDPSCAAIVDQLRQAVDGWMARTDDPLTRGHVAPPPTQAERLRREAEQGRLTGPLTAVEAELVTQVLGAGG